MSAPEGAVVTDRSPGLASHAGPDLGLLGKPVRVSTEGAVRGDPARCPVAMACREAWPGCEPHIEGNDPYVILADGTRESVSLDPAIVEEIGKFDRGEPAFEGMTLGFSPPWRRW